MDELDPCDSDAEGSELSDSFDDRQLTAAEVEGDPVPAVEGLSISGEARPGRFLQVCGWAINGTTRCDFAWARCSESGNFSYIEGENKATYLVTADDVDSYLAIEVIPVGNGEQMGEPVRIFANEHRKISCDPEMQEQIERNFFIGHSSFDVFLSVGCNNTWVTVKLVIEREGFSIKNNRSPRISVEEKFSPSIAITISNGHSSGFLIHCTEGSESLFLATESSLLRDVIVLTMRLFTVRAVKKQEQRSIKAVKKWRRMKRCLFF
ncbi:uncharacterized protein LOC120107117 [Phoenix dactylifera]|uniref:Uncharacterized protein LOC120107117 n=1 Tax=Phoenix dactylifera TaxID=42345 RepID=A0A8B8ZPQ1_PHODC|nr:uncharacterized protein LOC120107117 [Phoenix dactylifera]